MNTHAYETMNLWACEPMNCISFIQFCVSSEPIWQTQNNEHMNLLAYEHINLWTSWTYEHISYETQEAQEAQEAQ